MRKSLILLLLCLVFGGCVSVKSADGTCSARTLALISSGTASCGMLNGIETGMATGLDIGQLASMVAAYQKGGGQIPIPMSPAPTPTPAPRLGTPDDPGMLNGNSSDWAPRQLPPTSIHAL